MAESSVLKPVRGGPSDESVGGSRACLLFGRIVKVSVSMRCWLIAGLWLAGGWIGGGRLPAEVWTPEQMLQMKRVGMVVPSPDGTAVAYTVRQAIVDANRSEYLTQIFVARADGSQRRQLTRSNVSSDSPRWSPDGKQIAFLSARSGRQAIWVIPVDGGEAELLVEMRTPVQSFAWSPDGRWIALTAIDPPSAPEEMAARAKADVRVLDESEKYSRLYVVPTQGDKPKSNAARLLTPGNRHVTPDSFDWSPDSQHLVYSHTRSGRADDWTTADIAVVHLATGEVRSLAATPAAELTPKFSRDGQLIAFVKSDNPPTWAQSGRVHVMKSDGSQPRPLAPTADERPTLFGWSPDQSAVLCGEVERTVSRLFWLPLEGSPKPFSTWEGAASGNVFLSVDGRKVGFVWEFMDRPVEGYLTPTAEFRPSNVTALHADFNRPVPKTEVIRWKSRDGLEVEGLLTHPMNCATNRRSPLLVIIHGGPAGVFTQSFVGNASVYPIATLAARGYAVFRPNPRGSSGYGKEFRFANFRDWGGGDFRDILSGVEHLIETGVADPDRLGVMGWSYGGYMTAWIITQTKMFKAASVGAGVTNLVSFTGTSDIPSFLPSYLGSEFWDADTLYRDRSPVFKARGVTTPTLIQHGSVDERVPLSQGLELYNSLKRQGVVTRMIVYPRSPHAINEPRLLLDAMYRNVEWFERHVRKLPGVVRVPATPVEPVKEVLHGVEVVDPYRWLEDKDSPRTRQWLEEQHRYLRAHLDQLPGRDFLRKKLTRLLRVDTQSVPQVYAGRWFYSRRSAEQDQPVFVVKEAETAVEKVLLDANTLSPDRMTSATSLDVSADGRLWAYGLRRGGEDEVVVRFRDVNTLQDLPLTLPKARYFSVQVTPDRTAVYYCRMTPQGPRVYHRRIDTDEEKELFGDGYGPDKIITLSMPEHGRYLLITVNHGSAASRSEVYLLRLPSHEKVTIVNDLPARFVGRIGGDTLFLQTNWQAENGRILSVPLDDPRRERWKEIVPEDRGAALQGFALVRGRLFASYLKNVASQQKIYTPEGKHLGDVPFPGLGSGGVTGQWDRPEAFFQFSSFMTPPTTYRYDVERNQLGDVWFRPDIPVSSDQFTVRQVWYESKDGTRVPMFLVHRQGLKPDGSHPVLLTGYGGFNISRTPQFSATVALWCEQGGIYALPSLRGGGEFGEAWHRAGMLEKKQNVFDDFIAAAEWLIRERYTNPDRLAIAGGSNGGLLVGAAMTQRPELFRAVLCSVPLLDMVRYHKFLVARFWIPEYGSAEDPEQFKYLLAYSPYHRVKKDVCYPGVMFVTGDADTRVDPLHARKMCALLQANTGSGPDRPILLHYDTQAGHSAGKPVSRQIEDLVDEYAFLLWQLGVAVP